MGILPSHMHQVLQLGYKLLRHAVCHNDKNQTHMSLHIPLIVNQISASFGCVTMLGDLLENRRLLEEEVDYHM